MSEVVSSEADHVVYSLGAGCTVEVLGSKHRVIFISFSLKRHEKVIQILQILLEQLVRFVILHLVCKLVFQVHDHLVKIVQARFQRFQVINICLLSKLVVHQLDINLIVQNNRHLINSLLQLLNPIHWV